MSSYGTERQPGKSLAVAILTDVHFWVPFVVLLLGIAVLAVCAHS